MHNACARRRRQAPFVIYPCCTRARAARTQKEFARERVRAHDLNSPSACGLRLLPRASDLTAHASAWKSTIAVSPAAETSREPELFICRFPTMTKCNLSYSRNSSVLFMVLGEGALCAHGLWFRYADGLPSALRCARSSVD